MSKFTPIISTNKNSVKPKELMQIWASVGWSTGPGEFAPQTVKSAIQNTSLLISARNEDGKLIGMARVFSDGKFTSYLAELVVHPDYQGMGVGRKIVEVLKDRCGHTTIVFETTENNRKFYKKCGFKEGDMLIFYNW